MIAKYEEKLHTRSVVTQQVVRSTIFCSHIFFQRRGLRNVKATEISAAKVASVQRGNGAKGQQGNGALLPEGDESHRTSIHDSRGRGGPAKEVTKFKKIQGDEVLGI